MSDNTEILHQEQRDEAERAIRAFSSANEQEQRAALAFMRGVQFGAAIAEQRKEA